MLSSQDFRLSPPGLQNSPPLGLYIHIPWCLRKCPYCDFNSHAVRGEMPESAYIDSLLRELEGALPDVWGRPVETIFFGGGTPSLLSTLFPILHAGHSFLFLI